MAPAEAAGCVGWDIGGAHVKACWLGPDGRVRDARQWAAPLWQGLEHLERALAAAHARWPALADAGTTHALTMTGEMVDLFADREAGVRAIASATVAALRGTCVVWAGQAGWCAPEEVPARWQAIASANWLATAAWSARAAGTGLLVDIGSTTCDLIALADGRPRAQGTSDHERLASGELVYQGVVRTPLCALGPRVVHRGRTVNVMHEWFATTADVHRLLGALDAAHDLYPPADGGAKDAEATRQRLARMVGLDARDAEPADWLATAAAWRELQLEEIAGQAARVIAAAGLPPDAPVVAAGCGDFLAQALSERLGRPCRRFAELVPRADADDVGLATRVQVGAPAVAVALLHAQRERG